MDTKIKLKTQTKINFMKKNLKVISKKIIFLLCIAVSIIRVSGQTGIPVPEMTQSDVLVKNFIATHNITGATMALAKDGKIVYMRSFGYADINKTIPMR